jgi:hypothetical protein
MNKAGAPRMVIRGRLGATSHGDTRRRLGSLAVLSEVTRMVAGARFELTTFRL